MTNLTVTSPDGKTTAVLTGSDATYWYSILQWVMLIHSNPIEVYTASLAVLRKQAGSFTQLKRSISPLDR